MKALAAGSITLEKKHYTYADYAEWPEDFRCELIHGVVHMMAAPSTSHQRILGNLHIDIGSYLRGKTCEVIISPFDVRLNFDTTDDIVVQPDIMIVCDPSKIDKRGCKGAPDLVIEILSPSTCRHDRIIKMKLYKNAGVREYWIIDLGHLLIDVFILETGESFEYFLEKDEKIPVYVLDGFEIPMVNIFDKV